MKNLFCYLSGCLVALLLCSCGEEIEPGRTAMEKGKTVKAPVSTIKMENQPFIYEAVATISARTASTVSGKLMGTVREVRVKEGDRVKKGAILLQLDHRQVSASLKGTEAALSEARRSEASARSARDAALAGAELARSTHERFLRLLRENSVSRQEFDEVAARLRQAESALTQTTAMLEAAGHRVQQVEAALANARVNKKDATIRAPYDGKITAKMINVGDLASPGTPFFSLEKDGVYCADLVLPETHIHSVKLGQTVQVTIPTLGGKALEAQVGRIVPAADQKSRSFLIKVALPENAEIRSGMFARVEIPVGEAGMILIPSSAIIERGQLTGLYTVDAEAISRFRLIRTGKIYGASVEVLSGLKEGDRYVVSPPVGLMDGHRVEVTE